ncbi:hypothetical protein PVAP13_8NG081204 [Panicum virgatum]|uniref:Uncharacterized protein n=1 Tax=Panicum virgatum TaxID=38727 RepID=A0A8T0P5Z6_PANVG|nr:hypothetical protein PVAP13_8NG081204 [Panicum virgatum]
MRVLDEAGAPPAAFRRSRVPRDPAAGPDTGALGAMDPGALSVLLADEHVCGLQVRRGAGEWVTVQGPRQRWRNDGCAPHVPRQRTGGRRSKARGDSARGVRGEAHGGAGEPSGGSQPVLPVDFLLFYLICRHGSWHANF